MGRAGALPAGAPVRAVAESISPGLAKAALAGIVDGTPRRSLVSSCSRRERPHRDRPESGSAVLVPSQHRSSAGGGRHEPVSRHAVRHRSRDRRRVLLRFRRPATVRAGGSRDDREENAGACAPGSGLRTPDVATRRSEDILRRSRRAAQGPTDRREDRGPARRLLLHDQGQGDVHRLLRRAARADPPESSRRSSCSARRTRTGRATRETRRCSASTGLRS